MIRGGKGNFSRPIILVAIGAIALGLSVMFVSIAILTGFQKEIREKVIGFGGHIQISRFSETASPEPHPVDRVQPFLAQILSDPGISHIQVYATKAGIIKTADQIQGVVLKGVGSDFDWSFFDSRMVEGRSFRVQDTGKTDEIVISAKLASLMNLKLNDDLRMYFIAGSSTPGRKFRIAGIFNTGLEEFDKMYVLGDIRHIQRLNNWDAHQVGGFEIKVKDFDDLDRLGLVVYHAIGFNLDASTIRQMYPQIFDWLDLQDVNVLVILGLMTLVSAITMISTLLILILERTGMIGVLKALGMRNSKIRKIFLYNAIYIIGIGMAWGNLIGLGLCLIQQRYGIVTLPQESYYVPVVPVNIDLINILILNSSTLVICYLMLLIPSLVITRVSPVKAIKFN
jgi:lipoprotein-releasing system permease protein